MILDNLQKTNKSLASVLALKKFCDVAECAKTVVTLGPSQLPLAELFGMSVVRLPFTL